MEEITLAEEATLPLQATPKSRDQIELESPAEEPEFSRQLNSKLLLKGKEKLETSEPIYYWQQGRAKEDGSRDGGDWSRGAIVSLLDSWGEKRNEINKGKYKLSMKLWTQVSTEVSARCGGVKKPKDPIQCKHKIDLMKKRYKREKKGRQYKGDIAPSTWKWYPLMNTILGTVRKHPQPSVVLDSPQSSPHPPSGQESTYRLSPESDTAVRPQLYLKEETDSPLPSFSQKKASESNFCFRNTKPRKFVDGISKGGTKAGAKSGMRLGVRFNKLKLAALFGMAGKKAPSVLEEAVSTDDLPPPIGQQDPNLMTALMAFGAVNQQLEKDRMAQMEKALLQQSQLLYDLIKLIKHSIQEPDEETADAMAKREEMVQVEIYIAGKGPKHKIKVPLQGWERKQIDLEGIMSKYRLRSIYAYSLTSGRGLQLLYNPRNGLSFVSYSGKPDAVIRIDGDPKARWFKEVISVFGLLFVALIGVVGSAILNNHIVYEDLYGLTQWPWKWMMKPTITFLVGRYVLAAMLIGLVIVGTTTSQAHWFVQIQDFAGGQLAWLGCLVAMLAAQLAWQPFKWRS